MKKEGLLRYCKFYKGEEICPENFIDNERDLWEYEKSWVRNMVKYHSTEYQNKDTPMDEEITIYLNVGLREFESLDGRPLSLKAHIFYRMTKWNYSATTTVQPFKELYKKHYQ